MDDFDFDCAADTGEQTAYAAGEAEARAIAEDPAGPVRQDCDDEAAQAREIAADRAVILGAMLALLEACERAGADVAVLRDSTEKLVGDMAELAVDREAPEGTSMAIVDDDPVRVHCRRAAAKLEALARRNPMLKPLLTTSTFAAVSGNSASTAPPPEGKVSLEW
jgi:hypothetical protein